MPSPALSKDEKALTLKVIGHQWWWEVRYEADSPHKSFVTANEIRIPTGKPVRVELESADVIHSFWVPSLTGKMDLVTGQKARSPRTSFSRSTRDGRTECRPGAACCQTA